MYKLIVVLSCIMLCVYMYIYKLLVVLNYFASIYCSDGNNLVDFTYVANVVEGHILAEKNLGQDLVANGQVSFMKQLRNSLLLLIRGFLLVYQQYFSTKLFVWWSVCSGC